MKKHLNKILILVINALLTVIGALLIKDYNNGQADSASAIDSPTEPISGKNTNNIDSQTIEKAASLPVESVDPFNNSQDVQSTPAPTVISNPKNIPPATKTPSTSVGKSASKNSSNSSKSGSSSSSSNASSKNTSTPTTKTS